MREETGKVSRFIFENRPKSAPARKCRALNRRRNVPKVAYLSHGGHFCPLPIWGGCTGYRPRLMCLRTHCGALGRMRTFWKARSLSATRNDPKRNRKQTPANRSDCGPGIGPGIGPGRGAKGRPRRTASGTASGTASPHSAVGRSGGCIRGRSLSAKPSAAWPQKSSAAYPRNRPQPIRETVRSLSAKWGRGGTAAYPKNGVEVGPQLIRKNGSQLIRKTTVKNGFSG